MPTLPPESSSPIDGGEITESGQLAEGAGLVAQV